jgi:hypothetical protein
MSSSSSYRPAGCGYGRSVADWHSVTGGAALRGVGPDATAFQAWHPRGQLTRCVICVCCVWCLSGWAVPLLKGSAKP